MRPEASHRLFCSPTGDKKGDEMAKTIEVHLRSAGVRPDLEIRSRLKKLVKKEIKDVESLSVYVERMREQNGP